MKKLLLKISIGIVVIAVLLALLAGIFYIKILPFAVKNPKVISKIENTAEKYADVKLNIVNPQLITSFSPEISFSADKIAISKDNEKLFEADKLKTDFSLSEIFKKTVYVKNFGVDNIFADVYKLEHLFSNNQQNNKHQKNDWKFDLYDSVLYLNNSLIIYKLSYNTEIEIKADNLEADNTQKTERFIHFNINADIKKNNNTVHIAFSDDNKVVIKNKHIYINDCPLTINKSKMFFNAQASNDKDYIIEIYAKRFFIPDVIKLLQTNIIENNINDILQIINDIKGDFDFSVKITNNNLNGNIKLNKISAKIIPLSNLPFTLSSGDIVLNSKDLYLKNFNGYYNGKKSNDFNFEGSVKDYLKSLDTRITMVSAITNDFVKDYLSKTAGISLSLIGQSRSKIIITSKNNDIDVTLAGKIAKGDDILVDGASLSPKNFDRAIKAVIHVKGDNLNIETINYYIAKEITKASKGIKPILTLDGNIRISDGKIFDLGFDIPNPLPSEFLNVLIGQKMFKKGKFFGNLKYDNTGKTPVIKGNMKAEKILIPPQRMFLKEGTITTDNNYININADGKYRRSSFDFTGKIVNSLLFPIVIKNTRLTIDNINLEKIINSFNAPAQTQQQAQNAYNNTVDENSDTQDDENIQTFDFKNLIVEEAVVKIIKGNYKEINFGNIEAKMSLDKNSIFKLNSNKFDIGEGTSGAKIVCDLVNQKYSLKLGIKDVNSDLFSTALLNLKREISGKASGLIELNTDKTLKLNGSIKFQIKDGTIQKIGLVEYVLKFAALFRNPLAMISPSIFSDLVNIPEGNFDKIAGELILKNNVIELMKIKSYSPQLSAYIVGCFNLETRDAILRIYTKFTNKNKGIAGVLRNISLNSLANRINVSGRNDLNYYAAELEQLPDIDADEKDCQIFLTKVDGDVEHNNFISSLKKIK